MAEDLLERVAMMPVEIAFSLINVSLSSPE
jgi:hypothetical protein